MAGKARLAIAAAFTFAENTPTNEPVAVAQSEVATG